MHGIICEEANRFIFHDNLPEPIMTNDEAIVRIRRIGICGTDLHAYQGNQPFFSYPRILGHELAGFVEQVNKYNGGFQVGDQVCIIPYMHCGNCVACMRGKTNCCTSMKVLGVHVDGGMRERITVPYTHLIKTNSSTLDQTAVIEPLAIGAHAVRRSQLTRGETVLVIGAGPIGLGVMVFAKNAGARVIAMDINIERLAFCKSWAGVEHTVNAMQQPQETLSEITKGEWPTIVFDATGNAASMMKSFDYCAHGGTLVYVGLFKGEITFQDPEFHKREMTLMGSRNATRVDFDHVIDCLSKGIIDVERYITHRCDFHNMIDQFEAWLNPEMKVIKAMVEL